MGDWGGRKGEERAKLCGASLRDIAGAHCSIPTDLPNSMPFEG